MEYSLCFLILSYMLLSVSFSTAGRRQNICCVFDINILLFPGVVFHSILCVFVSHSGESGDDRILYIYINFLMEVAFMIMCFFFTPLVCVCARAPIIL
mmetsp:Transcript_13576/g.37565  ORF Transcript_13576/g.37565 Transcript_13576/m.37565 type:complete len:98 (+) Transcript_13576:674-967(+)